MSFGDACEQWLETVQLYCTPSKDDQDYRGVQAPNMTAVAVCLCCLAHGLNKYQASVRVYRALQKLLKRILIWGKCLFIS